MESLLANKHDGHVIRQGTARKANGPDEGFISPDDKHAVECGTLKRGGDCTARPARTFVRRSR